LTFNKTVKYINVTYALLAGNMHKLYLVFNFLLFQHGLIFVKFT